MILPKVIDLILPRMLKAIKYLKNCDIDNDDHNLKKLDVIASKIGIKNAKIEERQDINGDTLEYAIMGNGYLTAFASATGGRHESTTVQQQFIAGNGKKGKGGGGQGDTTRRADVNLEANINSPIYLDGRVITNVIQKKLLRFSDSIA